MLLRSLGALAITADCRGRADGARPHEGALTGGQATAVASGRWPGGNKEGGRAGEEGSGADGVHRTMRAIC